MNFITSSTSDFQGFSQDTYHLLTFAPIYRSLFVPYIAHIFCICIHICKRYYFPLLLFLRWKAKKKNLVSLSRTLSLELRFNQIFFSICFFFHKHLRFTGQQGKGEVISLTLAPVSQTLRDQPGDYCRELTSAHNQQPDSNQEPLVSKRKLLTTKQRALGPGGPGVPGLRLAFPSCHCRVYLTDYLYYKIDHLNKVDWLNIFS